ncbi:senecionine N-oxygenase-like [Cylas formicarius]|uniref:senecionine N-oxygenase-like n=1 Tax=Cylas formicarius TaxID=197179 RepID=UPI002958CC17|nr:senecionine N-oxygenase-like [Cylas formicarius]
METFTGRSVHSHSYRRPDDYKGKRVLVVGAGPSGVDISRILSDVAERVFLSLDGVSFAKIGASVVQKPLVVKLEGDRALFSDESQETIDDIIYCTGYQYSYPFLTERCGITVENNWVKYLYKHVVNVAHPTMGFIGVTFKVCPFPVVGVQVRFFLTLLGGRVKIDKEAMLDEVLKDMRRRKEMGWPEHHAHKIGLEQRAYVNDLADTGKIYRLKPVVCSLYEHLVEHRNDRKRFRILNDEEFEEF